MRFEFATAARIIFGEGTLAEAGTLAAGLGRCALVVTGRSAERAAPLLARLDAAGVAYETFAVAHEPTVDLALAGTGRARELGAGLVIAFGGGSVIDAGKAIAALLTNPGDPFDYLEVIGRGQPLPNAAAPVIAIPTTAGTGSEVTRNAVIISREHRVKVSLRSPLLLPRLVVVDPGLTHTLPPDITASTGLDALTQLLESYVSSGANPLTDGICREGLTRASRSLKAVYLDGKDVAAREDMALASLFSGIALANAKLGAVHGFAAAAGGQCNAPHGLVCACLLPHVEGMNLKALRRRAPDSPVLKRFEDVARILTGNPAARAEDGIAWLNELCVHMNVPHLTQIGIEEGHYTEIVSGAKRASSMKGNPIVLTDEELTEILHRAQ